MIRVLPFIIIMLGSIFPLNRLFFLKIFGGEFMCGWFNVNLAAVLLGFNMGLRMVGRYRVCEPSKQSRNHDLESDAFTYSLAF